VILRCHCGAHATAEDLPFVGWQDLGDGEYAALVNCRACDSTITGVILKDASRCHGCLAVITGGAGDPKIVVQHAVAGDIYCRTCAATMLYAGEAIEDGRALRRILAAGGHLHFQRGIAR
jgi:hypothetical protein